MSVQKRARWNNDYLCDGMAQEESHYHLKHQTDLLKGFLFSDKKFQDLEHYIHVLIVFLLQIT